MARVTIEPFHKHPHYQPLMTRELAYTLPGAEVQFSQRHPGLRKYLLASFEQVSVQHVGILHGEYLLMNDGLLLADRDGRLISGSVPDYPADYYPDSWLRELSDTLDSPVCGWDTWPLVSCLPVLTSPYLANYFHFSMEVIPRLRHFAPMGEVTLLIPPAAIGKAFQRDLLARTRGCMTFATMDSAVRARDPVLVQDTINEEGLLWLRHNAGLTARIGKRRIYIRRGNTGTRSMAGGGISESDAFLTLLRDFAFEVVEFGAGERNVTEQVDALDGAGIILASHGAALTNLVYLEQGAMLVEIFSPSATRACFMQLASTVGLRYFGTYTRVFDDNGDMVVDTDELREVLQSTT